MAIKRNATAEFDVEIGLSLNNIQSIEFLFKKEKSPSYPELLRKVYKRADIVIPEGGNKGVEGFLMTVKLKPDETFRLTEGRLYLDTRIVLSDGSIPVIEIEKLENVMETLFGDVYYDAD